MALKVGEKRVKVAQEMLTRYTGHALPALALKDTNDQCMGASWRRKSICSNKGRQWLYDSPM